MKRVLLLAALSLSSMASMAQISAYKQQSSEVVDGYTLPRTVIEVKVVQEREVILRGPYARYASQYLGVTAAPMSDKESYKILGATLSWSLEPDLMATYAVDSKMRDKVKSFNWLSPSDAPQSEIAQDDDYSGAKLSGLNPFKDVGTSTMQQQGNSLSFEVTSAVEKSTEQMAADAAAVIFKIRRRRIELITGEQGENVFGSGLKAALDEMQRIEDEYVSLFLGKRFVQRTQHTFEVVPQNGEQRVVAFRFTSEGGVVAPSDLMASPISLELTPIDKIAGGELLKPRSGVIIYRVPQMEQVNLSDGTTIFATKKIPVYQNGTLIEAPII